MSGAARSLAIGAAALLAIACGVAVVVGVASIASPVGAAGTALDASADDVSEEAYVEPVPERGDEYFEAEDPDEDWISYINPRDEYRVPDRGDGSGKVCVTLLNEAGDHVVGESVPDTTVTVPTGDTLYWHSDADPMVVDLPLSDHHEQPLDSDQFGTSPDYPQGDGYLDSHCLEWHNQPNESTIEYGEPAIEGDHADRLEVVGYVQQEHEAWDTDVDPIEDAVPYEEAGGWTYVPDGTHGQAVIVLQLTDGADGSNGDGTDGSDGDGSSDGSHSSDDGGTTDAAGGDGDDGGDGSQADGGGDGSSDDTDSVGTPGLAVIGAVVAFAAVVAGRYR